MNAIDDMQNEMDFSYHYNEFEYNQDYVIFFWKIDEATMEYEVLFEKDYYKFLFSETLTNTCEHKIESFTIEQKQFSKLILYKWNIVQLVIYIINEIINIAMN